MNYIELINLFWQTRRRVRLSSVEADLYFFFFRNAIRKIGRIPLSVPTG